MRIILVIIIIGIILIGCSFGEKTFNLNEEFNLKKNEFAKIAKTDLRIKMISAGHEFGEDGDTPYCVVKVNNNEESNGGEVIVGASIRLKKFTIKITKVDTAATGKGNDPFETTNCSFIVTEKIEK